MTDLKNFANRIKNLGQRVEDGVNRIVKETALAIDRELVLATPVDTGRARSNWIASVGSSVSQEIEPYSPGEGGSTSGANAQAAINQATAAINSRQPGEDIYLSNNLPYIKRLNEGHSAQAPEGFIETAIQNGIQVIENAKVMKK